MRLVRASNGNAELVETAQTTYSSMVKDHFAPRLRTLGLRGSGNSYLLPTDDSWALLGLQKSKWSTAEVVEFTISVTVVSHQTWDSLRAARPHLRDRPSPNTFYGPEVWWKRIGQLMDLGEDQWWQVRAGEPVAELAEAVAVTVEQFALPAMRDALEQPSHRLW
jgi:hypothetical protein